MGVEKRLKLSYQINTGEDSFIRFVVSSNNRTLFLNQGCSSIFFTTIIDLNKKNYIFVVKMFCLIVNNKK